MAGFLSSVVVPLATGALEQADQNYNNTNAEQRFYMQQRKSMVDKVAATQDAMDKQAADVSQKQRAVQATYGIQDPDLAYNLVTTPGFDKMGPDAVSDLIQRMHPTGQKIPAVAATPGNELSPGRTVDHGMFGGGSYTIPPVQGVGTSGQPERNQYSVSPAQQDFHKMYGNFPPPTDENQANDQYKLENWTRVNPNAAPPGSLITSAFKNKGGVTPEQMRRDNASAMRATFEAVSTGKADSKNGESTYRAFGGTGNSGYNWDAVSPKAMQDPVYNKKLKDSTDALLTLRTPTGEPMYTPEIATNLAKLNLGGFIETKLDPSDTSNQTYISVLKSSGERLPDVLARTLHALPAPIPAPQNTSGPSTLLEGNNFGGIRAGNVNWTGKGVPVQTKNGPFESFDTPENGVRAIVDNLKQGYQGLSLIDTISKRSPASDNNNPQAIAQGISKATGISLNGPLPLNDPVKMVPVVKAIIKSEGVNANLPDSVIQNGVNAAYNINQTQDLSGLRRSNSGLAGLGNNQNPSTLQSQTDAQLKPSAVQTPQNPNGALTYKFHPNSSLVGKDDEKVMRENARNYPILLANAHYAQALVGKNPDAIGVWNDVLKHVGGPFISVANDINPNAGDFLDKFTNYSNQQTVHTQLDTLGTMLARPLGGMANNNQAGMMIGGNKELMDEVFGHDALHSTPQTVSKNLGVVINNIHMALAHEINMLDTPPKDLSTNPASQIARYKMLRDPSGFGLSSEDARAIIKLQVQGMQ